MKENYLQKQNTPYLKDKIDIKPHLYLYFERKFFHPDFINIGYLHSRLKAQIIKFNISVTHLAMILTCSRPQYLRMGKGENRFKDEQLEALASLYGEDVSTYKDMQDVDYILKKIGYNENPERAIYLIELAKKVITVPLSNDSQKENLYPEMNVRTFNFKPISKEIQQQKIKEIIENLNHRFKQNDLKLAEIREKIVPMADAPNPEKAKLWQQFHLLEDEQISIEKLINKMKNLLSKIRKSK